MYRSPWELEAHVRHQNQQLAGERRRRLQLDRAAAGSPRSLGQLRRRLGIALIHVGAAIAGSDGLRGAPLRPAWPELAHR